MAYADFVAAKTVVEPPKGWPCEVCEVHPTLRPHQKDIVVWAVRGGNRAVFTAFGLGKTVIQLEILRLVLQKSGGKKGLVVLPLGVKQEFIRDAGLLGLSVTFVRTGQEVKDDGIYITNYESVREGKLDPTSFDAVSLDEASCLRGFGGTKTFREFMGLFEETDVPRFVATATPSPNEYIELLAYAAFLGIMDVGQAKTRFFRRNSEKADKLTIHPHKEREFWLWVSTWAVFVQRPSDLGHSDEGYELPPLDVIWHDLEAERHAIERAVPGVVSVFGNQPLDEREKAIIDFSNGAVQELAAKPVIAGSGCNFQRHCNWAVFLGIGFKFNDFIQAVHRLQRFLQTKPVRIDIVYTEGERGVREVLERKWRQHEQMTARMSEIIKEYGLSHTGVHDELKRATSVDRQEASGEGWKMVNNDCVLECGLMEADSVDLIVTSIPFSTQYEYSPSYLDFGHTDDNGHFWEQMDFLVPELLRVLKPGRVAAVHVKDRIVPGGINGLGFQTVSPFSDETVAAFQKHGFAFMARKTVVTDVVRENNQTYRLGWTEQCKDGTKMGAGMPEYVLVFRKPPTDKSNGYADDPVVKSKKHWSWEEECWTDEQGYSRARWQMDAHGFMRSSGDRLLMPEDLKNQPAETVFKMFRLHSLTKVYDHEHDVSIAEYLEREKSLPSSFMLLQPQSWHPDVWTDIARMRTLNMVQSSKGREMHLCPLQFDIVDRLVRQLSMEGETVFDPFAGIGTVPYRAVLLGRKGFGVELNPSYYADALVYLKEAELTNQTPNLFDLLEEEA